MRESGKELLKTFPLLSWTSFQEKIMPLRRTKSVSSYSPFTFEYQHNMHPEISKMVLVCTVKYLSLDRLKTGGKRKQTKAFV